jgi:hypothetical protein
MQNMEANSTGRAYKKTKINAHVETESIIPAFAWFLNIHVKLQQLRMAEMWMPERTMTPI